MATPLLLDTVAALRTWRRGLRAEGASLAFVPTMGKLHEGHLDLMRLARKHADQLLVSVFVNPTQFGPGEDYAAYPRDLAADLAAMASLAPEACFAPAATAIYPPGDRTTVSVNWGLDRLCGATRPGHFDGVTNVLARLFNLVEPDTVILGQKDAQQALIVKRMVDALHWPLRLRLAKAGGETDRAAGAHGRQRAHRFDGSIAVDADKGGVRCVWELGYLAKGWKAGDGFARGMNRPDAAFEADLAALLDDVGAPNATADYGYRARLEQPVDA